MQSVNYYGHSISVSDDAMAELGLRPGQAIDDAIRDDILRHKIAHVTTLIALEKAAKPTLFD